MDMIFLNIKSASRPGMRFADATDFLFDKRSKLANQKLLPLFRTPDQVIGQFVGDMFGVLCIHTRQCNICSNPCEAPVGAALPLLEREGDAAALPSNNLGMMEYFRIAA
jgi:hypothetical protein